MFIHAFFPKAKVGIDKSQQLGDFSCREGLRRPGENGMKRASQPVAFGHWPDNGV